MAGAYAGVATRSTGGLHIDWQSSAPLRSRDLTSWIAMRWAAPSLRGRASHEGRLAGLVSEELVLARDQVSRRECHAAPVDLADRVPALHEGDVPAPDDEPLAVHVGGRVAREEDDQLRWPRRVEDVEAGLGPVEHRVVRHR